MNIQWDKSLYSKINTATRAKLDKINEICRVYYPREYEGEWGGKTTLRLKINYLVQLIRGEIP